MPESATLALPSPAPAVAVHSSRWGQRVDVLLAGLVLVFAFFAGSFTARNSDLWLHLATGRAIATGEYQFGTDPFGYTTAGRYWANHAWLTDTAMFLAFHWLGGAGLVAIKAIVIAAVSGLMMLLARGTGPLWLSVGCVLLALMAMAPRLLLQPTIASLLLLPLTLLCLRTGGRCLYAIPAIIALWVNLDGWFILGPLIVGLFWFGRHLEGDSASPWPWWVLPAALLACLLSPHHVQALTLPFELSPSVWSSAFANDPRFAGLFASPWHWAPLGNSGGYNLAAWAFFVLLALGLVSFFVNPRAIRTWRSVVWLAFAVLAAWQVRLVPFFAVVAGPILALNLGEVVGRTALLRPGRVGVLIAGLALVGLAWFGWLTGFRNRDRGTAWAVQTDPSLQRAAEGIVKWRQQHKLSPEARVFATHPDFGHYLAWFAPGERCFLDSRLGLFTTVAEDYATLSRAVGILPDGETDPNRLKQLLGNHGIVAVSLADPDFARMSSAIRTVTIGQPSCWELVRVDGAAMLIVPSSSALAQPRFDADRMVFGTPREDDVPRAGSQPPSLAEPVPWWERPPGRGRRGSWEADASTVYLRIFEESVGPGGDRSPTLPLLAVRTARRGTEIDPADATAWLMLGRAYLGLGETTWERDLGDGLTLLGELRLVQITTVLVQAALHNPDSVSTHDALAQVFLRRQAFDLAHRHAAQALHLVQRGGPTPGESDEAFNDRVARRAEVVERMEAAAQEAENRFIVRTVGMSAEPLNRAITATQLGLLGKAVEVLLQSHPDLYGTDGLGLLAELLLQSGRAAEARVLLDRPELQRRPDALGGTVLPGKPGAQRWPYQFPRYLWLDLCQRAAAGDYDRAQAALDQLIAWLDAVQRANEPLLRLHVHQIIAIELGSLAPPWGSWYWLDSTRRRGLRSDRLAEVRFLLTVRGDLHTLAGVLELERGNPLAAAERFETALRLYESARDVVLKPAGEPLATRYAEMIRRHR